METLILGAGLAGLACSYHLGHSKCLLVERSPHPYGHIRSEFRNGFTWDQGPHVSFTKDHYVKELFAESVDGAFEEYPVRTRNYYHGLWIDHPAQSNLFQLPEPLRSECVDSLLQARAHPPPAHTSNYSDWLAYAFGRRFSELFASRYTRKYWTVDPCQLGTDWIGRRVFFPTIEDVLAGAKGPLPHQTHYVTHVRYPTRGGYEQFARKLLTGSNCIFGTEIFRIDLDKREVFARKANSTEIERFGFERLVNTIPLPEFLRCCVGVPHSIVNAREMLACSELLLVNIGAPHETQIDGNWFYIYDEEMQSTRINCTERLSPHNAPAGQTGVQVEVYANPRTGFTRTFSEIASEVVRECVKMGFLRESVTHPTNVSFRYVKYANVICDLHRRAALDAIFSWLETKGLIREESDVDAFTDWETVSKRPFGRVALVGRFAQWKYFWTDDCVLSAERLSR